MSQNITHLLKEWSNGDERALNELTPLVYEELRQQAARYMRKERAGHSLQATALINEAYLRLVDWKDIQWADRAHFFAMAANMMRRVLVDHARSRGRLKRGGEAIHVSLAEAADVHAPESADMLALDDVLRRLEELDPRKSRIVEMRFFGGLTLEESAEALNVSVATVRRDWALTRAFLFSELKKMAT